MGIWEGLPNTHLNLFTYYKFKAMNAVWFDDPTIVAFAAACLAAQKAYGFSDAKHEVEDLLVEA